MFREDAGDDYEREADGGSEEEEVEEDEDAASGSLFPVTRRESSQRRQHFRGRARGKHEADVLPPQLRHASLAVRVQRLHRLRHDGQAAGGAFPRTRSRSFPRRASTTSAWCIWWRRWWRCASSTTCSAAG